MWRPIVTSHERSFPAPPHFRLASTALAAICVVPSPPPAAAPPRCCPSLATRHARCPPAVHCELWGGDFFPHRPLRHDMSTASPRRSGRQPCPTEKAASSMKKRKLLPLPRTNAAASSSSAPPAAPSASAPPVVASSSSSPAPPAPPQPPPVADAPAVASSGKHPAIPPPPLPATDDDDDDDDVVFLQAKQAHVPLPHARYDCPHIPHADGKEAQHCEHCWCCLCETAAASCQSWVAHCKTTASEDAARSAAKRQAALRSKIDAVQRLPPPPLGSPTALLQLDFRWLQLRHVALSWMANCGCDEPSTAEDGLTTT